MAVTVGVRFHNAGKVYDFDPGDRTLLPGELVMVETAYGLQCGEVVRANREVADDTVSKPLRTVLRVADDMDRRRMEENAAKEREAMRVCQQRIEAHGLDMKLVNAEFSYDGSKILFNFTADGRVDFRDLVKDLAGVFHTRIELHQIGVRDEAKKLGGVGICGEPLCCARFLKDFQPVSIKMAKEQGLSLNPTKISGSCGRLMCCLKYEQDVYEELWKISPKTGAVVTTPEGRGVVTDISLLTGNIKVRLDKNPDSPAADMRREDVQVVRDNRGGHGADAPAMPKSENADASRRTQPAENRDAGRNGGSGSHHHRPRGRGRSKKPSEAGN